MRKKVVRLTAVFAALILWMVPARNALADLIWEPSGDFYMENPEECEYEGRDYLTNGKEGFVVVYEAPGKPKETGRIKNGKRLYVGFTYQDGGGNRWGAVNLWGYEPEADEKLDDSARDGWVLMEKLAGMYMESDFRTDHEKEFSDYQGELDGYEIREQLILWDYPGSGQVCGRLEEYFGDDGLPPAYQYLYTDQDGIRWTYVGYYYGEQGWVCVEDPESEELSLSYGPVMPEEELYPAGDTDGEADPAPYGPGSVNVRTAAIAVILVVIVTAALIAVVFKRKGD